MRVATYYETRLGRNDGPPLYWTKAMKDMGIEVVHLSSRREPDKSKYGEFDLHVWIDWGEDGLTGLLPYKPISMKNLHPSVYVTSDTHLGFDYRLKKAREFDYVFCNQKRAVEEFAEKGVVAEWLPHAVDLDAYPNTPEAVKKYDVGFVGFVSFEKRAIALDRIFKEFPNFYYASGKWFEEAAECYRKCRVVFNTAAVDDINMRLFEVCATGSAQIVERVPFMDELEGMSSDMNPPFYAYKDIDNAVSIIKYLLNADPGEIERVQNRARNWICSHHTYKHRVETILNVVKCNGAISPQIIQDTKHPYDRSGVPVE